MANSSLATWKWSGSTDHYNIRDHKIDTITIHHMAGNLTLAGCCSAVQSRGGSCNYCIDSSGKIGVMVDEQYRSWCSSNRANDMRAVTIEVANDSGDPNWHVSDKALAAYRRTLETRGAENIRVEADTPGLVSVSYELGGVHKLLKLKGICLK